MFDPEAVLFARASIDRAAHLRGETAPLMADNAARAMVLWRGKALFRGAHPRLAWVDLDHPILAEAVADPIFLGLEGGAPRFAYDISAWNDPNAVTEQMAQFADISENRHPSMAEDEALLDLRGHMGAIDPLDAGNAASAKGIFSWHARHRFCANCGAPSDVVGAGWSRSCGSCGARHFPRTDPVVIMLILEGDNVLMGRSPGWPEGMFSLLAGFVEPGETIEAAVRRETIEEAGVKVGRVGYLASQPWPFPASLMIGCWGAATSTEIKVDPVELEQAHWVSRQDMVSALAGDIPGMKPARKGSIARFLIENWLADRLPIRR